MALGIRLAVLLAAVLGLAGMGLNLSQSRQATIVVADLSASDIQDQSAMQRAIDQAARERPADAQLGVVTAGRDARVEQPPSFMTGFDGFQTRVDQDYTNLDAGLSLANAILPDGYRRRIVMMTDGQQNAGDALATARLLHSIGVRVDVWPVHVSGGSEVLVDSVTMPSELRPEERFSIDVAIRSTVNTTGTLTIYRDHTLILSRQEPIQSGESHFVFAQAPLHAGFHSYQVQINPAIDTQPENNAGSAFTLVAGPPKVLVISPSAHEAANVLASLHTTGIRADFQKPADVTPTLSSLQRYGALILVDTPADALDPELVSNIVPYVRDLGHGLVVIGGREAYGMGGYGQTGLEQALPVKMDLPKRKDLPSAAVVLIIESLESNAQVDISKQAGKGVIGLLTQQDQIAVSGALGNSSFAVPLQHVTDKRAIDNAIDQMQPGDPISYAPDLQAAYNALKKTSARIKHIILLGDGDAEDPGYELLAKRIRRGGVTISTIATNGLGFNDFQTMQYIAKWGGGRYYRGDDTSAIPRIFLREARTVARSGFIEGKFYPEEISANPMLRDVRSVPDLTGYVATTPKPTGEMVLVSKKLDPVLAAWQFGLGRSVAWTSDAAGLWTRDWLQAPGANRFWANLVSWTLPATQGGRLFIEASTGQGQGRISIDTPPSLGANPSVTAHILTPDLQTSTIQLQPSAPGHFTGSFLANTPGAYFVTADARGVDHAEAGQTGLDVPYSAEYRTTGTNTAFIRDLAAAGGGSVISRAGAAWQDSLAAVYARTSLQVWFWLLALLLLPVDIGVRRLVVTRDDLITIRRALSVLGRPAAAARPALAPLGALRQERAKRRSAPHPAAPPPTVPATAAPLRTPRIPTPKPAASSSPAPTVGAPREHRGAMRSDANPSRAPAPAPTSAPTPAGDTTAQPATTTSQLLAAKRKRRT
jgi:uncharacterized membrane protein